MAPSSGMSHSRQTNNHWPLYHYTTSTSSFCCRHASANIHITLANPPSLPPTVEEAYRRKCIQLRARTNEIEEENDAYRLRAIRLRRQIQKLRLERAILLEQIQKRTSTNVEDSEGSPSPPPTVCQPSPSPYTPSDYN